VNDPAERILPGSARRPGLHDDTRPGKWIKPQPLSSIDAK